MHPILEILTNTELSKERKSIYEDVISWELLHPTVAKSFSSKLKYFIG